MLVNSLYLWSYLSRCGEETKVGVPTIDGAVVEGTVEKHGLHKKSYDFCIQTQEKDSHRKQGHVQPYTKVIDYAIKRIRKWCLWMIHAFLKA